MFLFHFEAVYLCNGVDAGSLDFSMLLLCGPDLILEAKPLRILSAIFFLTSAPYSLYCLHREGYFLVYTLGVFVTQYGSPFIFHLLYEMKTKLEMDTNFDYVRKQNEMYVFAFWEQHLFRIL